MVVTLSSPIPADEPQRLTALRALDILDTAPEIAYDEIAELAAQICHCPIAYISFIDDDRQWLKARYGLRQEFVECPRTNAMCSTTICGTEVLVVPDMRQDPRFDHSPVGMADPPCRFYCGMPLITGEGFALGSLCVMARDRTFKQGQDQRRRGAERAPPGIGSTKLFVDETRAPVLDPGRGRAKTGYFWTLARDDRPWGGTLPPAVVYTYAPGRGHEHAFALLNGFTGVLQTDGYGAYKALSDLKRAGGPVTLVHCWAHCRRKFIDIVKGAPAPIAAEALRRIAAFYEDRSIDPWDQRRDPGCRSTGKDQTARRGPERLVPGQADRSLWQIGDRPSDPLLPRPLGWADPLPR